MVANFYVDATISGGDELRAAFAGLGDKLLQWGGGAVYEEATDIINVSLEVVPVGETGNLKGSGKAHYPEVVDGQAVVYISYGDASVDYAVVQHETPPSVFRHNEGQSWKYLERPTYEATRGMGERIAANIRSRISREL